MSSPLIRTGVLVAALAAALAFSGSALAAYPTKPAFDPLPAVVVPDENGSVALRWTSTFYWSWAHYAQRYWLKIESHPLPPFPATTESRYINLPVPAIRDFEGPLANHQTLHVGAGLAGHYVVRVQASVWVAGNWDIPNAVTSEWAVAQFDVAPAPPPRRG